MRGAPGGRAVDRKRLLRLAVIGVVAIVAAVLLIPQIRDLADGETTDEGIPEGLDVFRAASNGTDVFGIGGELDGETAHPRVFVFEDGEWRIANTPDGASLFGDVAVSGDRIAIAGSAEGGRAVVWTSTLPDLEWEVEEIDAPTAELRGVAMRGDTIAAVGSVLDETGAAVVLVRTDAGWNRPTLPGDRPVPMAVVATSGGFVIGGSSADAPMMWTSPDGLAWAQQPVVATKGAVQALAASGDAVMAIGVSDRIHVAFAMTDGRRTPVALPTEDAGELAWALALRDNGWIVVGQDIDVGDVAHAIVWTGDASGLHWSLNERVAADRLTDVVVVDGRPHGVGSLERGGRLTPVLLPL